MSDPNTQNNIHTNRDVKDKLMPWIAINIPPLPPIVTSCLFFRATEEEKLTWKKGVTEIKKERYTEGHKIK